MLETIILTTFLSRLAGGFLGRYSADKVKGLLADKNDTVIDKLRLAFMRAESTFYKKYGKQYGSSDNSFLASQENFERFLNSLDFSKSPLTANDFSRKGFDGLEDVPVEVIEDFITITSGEIENDFDLKTYFGIQTILSNQERDHELLKKIDDKLPTSPTKPLPKELTPIPRIALSDVVGREDELAEVKKILKESEKLVLVNGLGGVGKTTLAKAFIKKYENNYTHFVWLNASPNLLDFITNEPSLKENLGLRQAVDQLLLENKSEVAYNLILNELKTIEGNNVLVVDNTQTEDEAYVRKLTEHLTGSWKILLTSRRHFEGCEKYQLGVLKPDKAKELFLKYFKRKDDEKVLEELLKHIGYHTLSIELLAKTAQKNKSLTLSEILTYLQTHQLDHKRLAIGVKADHTPEEVEMYTHLISIFDLNELSSNEQFLLKQFAILPPIEIEAKKLHEYLGIKSEEESEFYYTLQSLVDKGYLSEINNALKTHQIIKELTIYKLGLTFEECETLMEYFSHKLNHGQNKDNPVDAFPYLDYGIWLKKNLEMVESKKDLTIDQSNKFSAFLNNLALVYKDIGRYGAAAELLKKVLDTYTVNLGEYHSSLSVIESNLAIVYQDLGRYRESKELLEKALQSDIVNYGANNPKVTTRQSNLALVYKDLGRYEEAARLLEKALASDIANFSDGHPNVAMSQSNLATVYQDLGRYEEASELLEISLLSDTANFGEKHPKVTCRQSNLASVYQNLGRYDEAAVLMEKALLSDESNFGESHPSVANSRSNLAMLYRDLGRYEEAARLLEHALQTNLACFGDRHPKIAIDQSNLALVYQNLGQNIEAVSLLEKSVKILETHFEKNHPDIAQAQANLALLYKDLGRYKESAVLLENVLEFYIQKFGINHPNTSIVQSNLASVYQDLGQYQDALALSEKALSAAIIYFGENHPKVATRQSNLAVVFQKLGQCTEAATLFEKSLSGIITIFGEKHPEVSTAQLNLAMVYRDLGRYEEAAALLQKSLLASITNFGEKHPIVTTCQSNLALVFQNLGRYEEAARLLEKSIPVDIKNLGENHPTVAIHLSNLSLLYRDLGRFTEAVMLLEKALPMTTIYLTEKHPTVITLQSNLATVYLDLKRYTESEALLLKALQTAIKNFGGNHPTVATLQSNLAIVYYNLERYEEALELKYKSQKIFIEKLGINHPYSIMVQEWIDTIKVIISKRD